MEDIDRHENMSDILDLKNIIEINSKSNMSALENSSNHNYEVYKDKFDSNFEIKNDDQILEFDSEVQALQDTRSLKFNAEISDKEKSNLDYVANTEILPSHTDLISNTDNISFRNKLLLVCPNKSQNFNTISVKNVNVDTKKKANCFTDNLENTFHQNKKIKMDYENTVNLMKTNKEDPSNKSISFEELIFSKNVLPSNTKMSKYKIETEYKHLNSFKVDSNYLVDASSTNQFSTMSPSIPFRDIVNDKKNFNFSDKNKKLSSDDTGANKVEENIKEIINNKKKKVIISEQELSKKTYACKEIGSSEESDFESEIKKCYKLLANNDVKANALKCKTNLKKSTKQTNFSLKNNEKNIRSNNEYRKKFISPIAENNTSEKIACINEINQATNSHCKKATSPTKQMINSEKNSPEKLFKFALKSLISGLESESNVTCVNHNDTYNSSPSEDCDQKILKDEKSNSGNKNVKDYLEDKKNDVKILELKEVKKVSTNEEPCHITSVNNNDTYNTSPNKACDQKILKDEKSNINKNVQNYLEDENNDVTNLEWKGVKKISINEEPCQDHIFKLSFTTLDPPPENNLNSTLLNSFTLSINNNTKILKNEQSNDDDCKKVKDFFEEENTDIVNSKWQAMKNSSTNDLCNLALNLSSASKNDSLSVNSCEKDDLEVIKNQSSTEKNKNFKDNLKEEKNNVIKPEGQKGKYLSTDGEGNHSEKIFKPALELLNSNSLETVSNAISVHSCENSPSLKFESSTQNKTIDKKILEDKPSNVDNKNSEDYLENEKDYVINFTTENCTTYEKNTVLRSDSSTKSINNDQAITNVEPLNDSSINMKGYIKEEKHDVIDQECQVIKHLSNNEVKSSIKFLHLHSPENLPNSTSLPSYEKTSSLKCERSTSSKKDDKNIPEDKPSNNRNKNGKDYLKDEKDNILIKPITEISASEKSMVSKSDSSTKNINDDQEITNDDSKNFKDCLEEDDPEWQVKKHLSNNEVKPALKLLNSNSSENLPNSTALLSYEKTSSLKCESSASIKNNDKNVPEDKPSNNSNKIGRKTEDEKDNTLVKPTAEICVSLKSGEKSMISKSDGSTKTMKDDQEITNDNKNIKDYLEEEKDDIINPEWQAVKNLSTNEERYKQVRKCWKSRTVPDPNKNLTYHSYRKRHFDSSNLTTRTRQHKRQASNSLCGRAAKRFCTFFIDEEINSIEKIKNERKREIFNEMHERIVSVDRQCFQMQRQTFYDNYGWDGNDEYYRHQNRVAVISEEYNKRADSWEETFRYQMQTLQERRNEVLKFYRFYKGLSDSSDDPTVLTDTQFQELNEIENMYRQFYNYYENQNN